ncbi:MAG: hypothetical protein ACRETP_06855, partial [Steroidobacteraceae bacterium]
CGGAFAYWWFRRRYQDVTPEYTRGRQEIEEWRRGFEERLAERPPVDLHPLSRQVAALDAAVRAMHIPQPEPTDLRPVLDAIAGIRMPERVDLAPVQLRLDTLESRVAELRMPEPSPAPDFTPLERRLAALEDAVRSIQVPPAQTVDLSLVLERLGTLQSRVENPPPPGVEVRDGSRNLLAHASHGKPDDLKQIKGVARSLERTLHKVGVFYFWQIAEWSPEDVAYVDSKLTQFHGRIERDDWVTQAGELAGLPTAAHRPAQH